MTDYFDGVLDPSGVKPRSKPKHTMRELINTGNAWFYEGVCFPTVFWLKDAIFLFNYGIRSVMCADIDNTKPPVIVTMVAEAMEFYKDIPQDTYDELDWTKMYPWFKEEKETFEWVPNNGEGR